MSSFVNKLHSPSSIRPTRNRPFGVSDSIMMVVVLRSLGTQKKRISVQIHPPLYMLRLFIANFFLLKLLHLQTRDGFRHLHGT